MSVITMKKLTLVAPVSDCDRITRELQWLCCVEVAEDETAGEMLSPLGRDDSLRASCARSLRSVDSAAETLVRYSKRKKPLLSSGRIKVSRSRFSQDDPEVAEAVRIADEANSRAGRISEIKNETVRLNAAKTALDPWLDYDLPLSLTGTKDTYIRLGVLPQNASLEKLRSEMDAISERYELETVAEDSQARYVALICYRTKVERLQRVLVQYGFNRIDFKDYCKTPAEESDKIKKELAALEKELAAEKEKLAALAVNMDALETAHDILKTSLASLDAEKKLYASDSTVYMSAYVPLPSVADVEKTLSGYLCAYEFSDPAEDEDIPVMLKNNGFASPFESVVGMYSYPKYKTYDPTFIMSIFFFIIFGFMLADVGYGLILSVACGLFLKFKQPRGGTKNLITLFAICGVSCMLAGVLLGSYFGDLPVKFMTSVLGVENPPNIALLLDPIANPIGFLILSLALGAAHLLTGMGIKFYVLCKNGHFISALFDVGSWFVLFAGIALFVLVPAVGKYVAIAGVAMLVLTQGRAEKNIIMKFLKGLLSLYDSVNYIADLLSYSRIMALGLASAVIASVVNTLGAMGGVAGLLIGLVVGHTLNLVINLLGAYVHTSRLQYIEFFGKFYEDGGRGFTPLSPDLKYSDVIE